MSPPFFFLSSIIFPSSSTPLAQPVRLGGVTQKFGRPWRGEAKKGGQLKAPSKHDCGPSTSSRGGTRPPSRCKALTPGWAPDPNLAWSSLPTGVPTSTAEFRVASACPPPTRRRDSPLPFTGCTHGCRLSLTPPRRRAVCRTRSQCGWGLGRDSRTGSTRNRASLLPGPSPTHGPSGSHGAHLCLPVR